MQQSDPPVVTSEQWASCVAAVDDAHIIALAKWRGWLYATSFLLRDKAVIGLYNDCWCFPNVDPDGDIRSIHFRLAPKTGEKAAWRHTPIGTKTHALVIGDLKRADKIAVFESQWDAITLIDKLAIDPFTLHDWALVSTRGASNAKVLEELDIPPSTDVYLFPQNDEAGKRWTDAVLDVLGRGAFAVSTPHPHKDLGEWGLNGLDSSGLLKRIKVAELRKPTPCISSKPQPNLKTAFTGVPDFILAEYGLPAFLNTRNEPAQLNERFWAALYAHENIILYEPDEHQFFVYEPSNGLYHQQSIDTLRGYLQTRIRQASTLPNYSGLLRLASEANLRGVIAFLRGQVEKRHAFRPAANFIHLANGVLEFKDGEFAFEKFNPKFMSRNQSPVSYDKDAIAPRFRDEFLRPLHAVDRILIQKYFGQALLGRNITQTILLLDGESDTGKTTLAKIMRNLIGVENSYQLRTNLLNDRFEIGRYIGKTFLLAGDVDAKFLSTEGVSRLKALVGGDPLPAELKKNNAQLTVEGVFNVVITSNCRLLVKLQGDVEAWRRRLLVVRYENSRTGDTIPDFDRMLVEEEGSGILNFALQGIGMLFADLAGNCGRIKLTSNQKERLNKLLDESDSLRVFLKTTSFKI
jgi:hypothetical protein